MNRIFVCGDTHGSHDIEKLNSTKWKEQKDLNKTDVLIQLGDCGLIWYPQGHSKYKSDLYWQKWIAQKNYTFCFVDGNHENHNLINELPIIEKWGGKVGVLVVDIGYKVFEIYHLKRGEIYTINNKKILVIGGAESQDKESRKANIDWWEAETLSKNDETNTLDNLDKHQWKVDYIFSHTCPTNIGHELANLAWSGPYGDQSRYNRYISKSIDSVSKFLEHIHQNIEFKEWHFGHWHFDKKINKEFYCHYNNVPYELKEKNNE